MRTVACLMLVCSAALAQSFEVKVRGSDTWLYAMNLPPNGPLASGQEPTHPAVESRPTPPPLPPVKEVVIAPTIDVGVSDTVDVTCVDASSLIPLTLGKKVSKIAKMYVCYITNNSTEAVQMSEGAILRRVPQLLPYDGATFSLALRRVVSTSIAERIVRLLADPTNLFLVLGAGRVISVSAQVLTGFAVYNAEVPYVQQRIQGVELPVQTNYQALAIAGSVQIAPGDTVVTHIFGQPQTGGVSWAQFRLSVANAPRVRNVR